MNIIELTHTLPAPELLENSFSTEAFVKKAVEDQEFLLSDEAFLVFDRLCKKIDVVGSLRTFYTKDLARNMKPIVFLRQPYTVATAYCLLEVGWRRRDLKLVNSVLKMLDGRVNDFKNYPPEVRSMADQVLSKLIA